MTQDKLKQYIALFGGVLGALLIFLKSLGLELTHFNDEVINSLVDLLTSMIPFILVMYGVWKNTYIVTRQAKKQEEELKKQGLK